MIEVGDLVRVHLSDVDVALICLQREMDEEEIGPGMELGVVTGIHRLSHSGLNQYSIVFFGSNDILPYHYDVDDLTVVLKRFTLLFPHAAFEAL